MDKNPASNLLLAMVDESLLVQQYRGKQIVVECQTVAGA